MMRKMIRRYGFNIVVMVSFLPFCIQDAWTQEKVPQVQKCFERNKAVKQQLLNDNPLFLALDQNEIGDGIVFPWMAKMKDLGIKHAVGKVNFRFDDRILNLEIDQINLFNRYYYFPEVARIKQTNNDVKILENDLRISFFVSATQFLRSINPTSNSCGSLYLNLLDDACLPIRDEIPTINKCEAATTPKT